MRMIWQLALVFLVVFGLLVLAWSQQRVLMYVPDPNRVDPAAHGLSEADEIVLRASDGVNLIAWYGAAKPGQPTLLYFHGNAGNLLSRIGRTAEYLNQGYGVFMLSYRGYSGSGGKPTEANNIADATLAYQWLLDQGIVSDDIVLYGESLGSGIAVQLAAKSAVGGIVLDAPYTSIADVGARIYPWLPVQRFILDRYDSMARIREVTAPLLIIHGANDTLIPLAMGRRLFEQANEPKQFSAIAGAGHTDHHQFGSYDVIFAWLAGARSTTLPARRKASQ